MLTFDGDFTDIGNNPVTWNVFGSDVSITNSNKKFGTGSIFFNNTTAGKDCYIMSDRAINCLNGNQWTIDWWEYRTSSTNPYPVTFDIGHHSNYDDETLVINHGENLVRLYNHTSSPFNIIFTTSTANVLDSSITLNVWNHMAVCKKNSTFYLFKNGQLQNSLTGTLNLSNHDFFAIGQNILGPGRSDQMAYQFQGYIDMFRISSVCLWTTNFNHNKIQY